MANTISRADLAATAAAIIHGYSHIATDSLTSMHQLKSSSHTQTPTATISREMSSNPLPKQSTSHHRPSISIKSNPTQALKLTLLLGSRSQPALTLRIPPSKQLALRKIPSTISTGMQKSTENMNFYIINQTQPSHLSHLVPIQLP